MKKKSPKMLLCSLVSVILCLSMFATFTVSAYGVGTKYEDIPNQTFTNKTNGDVKFTALEGMTVVHDKTVKKSINTIYKDEIKKNKNYNPNIIDGDLCAFSVKVVLSKGYKNRYARIYRTTLTKNSSNGKSKPLNPKLDSAVDKKWANHISYGKTAFVDLLGHANDITAIQMNGYVNLFVATGTRGDIKSNTFYNMVQFRVVGNDVYFVKGYFLKDNNGKELKPYSITVAKSYKDGDNSVQFMVSPSVDKANLPVYTFNAKLNNSHYRLADSTFKTSKQSYTIPYKNNYTTQSYYKKGNDIYVGYSGAVEGKNQKISYVTRYTIKSGKLTKVSERQLGYKNKNNVDKEKKFEIESMCVLGDTVYYSVNTNGSPNDFIASFKY